MIFRIQQKCPEIQTSVAKEFNNESIVVKLNIIMCVLLVSLYYRNNEAGFSVENLIVKCLVLVYKLPILDLTL